MSTQIRTDSAVFFEVFSAQSAGKAVGWRLVEAEREFDKLLRGFVVSMNEGTKVCRDCFINPDVNREK